MFTFAAVTAPSRSVPVVRTMLDAVVGRIMGGTAAPDTITKGPVFYLFHYVFLSFNFYDWIAHDI